MLSRRIPRPSFRLAQIRTFEAAWPWATILSVLMASITLWGSAVITRWGSAVITRWGSAVITLLASVMITLWGSAVIAQETPAGDAAAQSTLLVFVSAFAPKNDGAIHAYRFDTRTGAWKLAKSNHQVEHPFFFALSPDQKFLYSIDAPGTFGGAEHEFLKAWKVDIADGTLTPLDRQSTRGTASCYVDIDSTGKMALVANYSTGSVASFPILASGDLGPIRSFVQHEGSSVNAARQTAPHAHCFVISPDNRFAFAADLGIDQILAYRLDPAEGSLSPAAQPFVRTPPGAGPRHLIFDPSGKHVYVINELLNSVTHFDYLADSGMLVERATVPTLPADFKGTSHCADLKITPDGKFLYGTNRGHDSIAAYAIGPQGDLSLIEIRPSLGEGPQNLAITPDGKWLLCANMPGHNVATFAIDPKSGKLTPVGDPLETTSPSCIAIVTAK
jgi:6-phosphogluconolactonase